MQSMFDRENDHVRIKSWLKENIHWLVADAGDPQLPKRLGCQDMVIANKFLCHMAPPDAETCLRNIAHLVNPGGYLLVSGVDLDIRTKVANELGWTPVPYLLEKIHDGDPSVRRDWPWKYWGLEPLDAKRRDWSVRYASVFRVGPNA
jgi:chemotaxis protein methyltransferase CheR